MKLLKTALALNAASCIAFGTLFLLGGEAVSEFIGNTVSWLMPLVGGILLFNGGHLLLARNRNQPLCPEILYFIFGDLLWVIGSLVLVILGAVITTQSGIFASVTVAFMVAAFAVMQVAGYKQACSQSA